MNVKLKESVAGGILGKVEGKRLWHARLIATGPGSSGFYTEDALKNTGPAAWPKGTKINADHQTWEDYLAKPAGSITTMIGVIASDPVYEEPDGDLPGLYADVEFLESWAPFVEQVGEFVGLSIQAYGYGEETNEAGLQIIEGFLPSVLNTVDLVTAPGARGKLINAIESFREQPEAKKVIEALSNDRRAELNNLLKDAYSAEDTWIWVRDFDEHSGSVYFDVEGPDVYGVFSQTYSVENDVATSLSGERVEVRSQTKYVPLNTTSTSTEEAASKEKSMTPEEQAALAVTIAEAVAKALKPEPVAESEEDKVAAPDMAAVAEAAVAAGLPEPARTKVYEAVKGGAEIDAAIETEKSYIASIAESASAPTGTVRTAEAATVDTRVNGWAH